MQVVGAVVGAHAVVRGKEGNLIYSTSQSEDTA